MIENVLSTPFHWIKHFTFIASCLRKKETSQLANAGISYWKNFESHETNNVYINNMRRWIELEMRLQKNLTIDKAMQYQIAKIENT